MITNEQEYRSTREAAEQFERALQRADTQGAHLHPRLRQAMREGIESQLAELREQLAAYEASHAGRDTVVTLDSLEQLPDVLVRARVAAGVSTAELADRLGWPVQLMEEREATRYAGVGIEDVQAVVSALGVRLREQVVLPPAAALPAAEESASLAAAPAASAAHGLAGVLKRVGLTLQELAARLNIPVRAALWLQRGRIDAATLPGRLLDRLAGVLGTSAESVRALLAGGPRRTGAGAAGNARAGRGAGRDTHRQSASGPTPANGNTSQDPLPGGDTPRPGRIMSFREALEACPELTPDQRREWLEETA